MTGKELLLKELEELGATKQQMGSKVVDLVIQAFAKLNAEGVEFDSLKTYEDQLKEYKRNLDEQEYRIRCGESKLTWREHELQKREWSVSELEEEISDLGKQIDDKKKELESIQLEYETPEARDKARLAQWFKDNTDVINGYDRTAFITGLGQILGGYTSTLYCEDGEVSNG